MVKILPILDDLLMREKWEILRAIPVSLAERGEAGCR